jgi:hypothetical protein
MSISVPYRYPSWDEMRAAWYTLIPDAENITGAMFFPKKSEYVNVHQNCFHVYEVPESEIPRNAKIFSQVL